MKRTKRSKNILTQKELKRQLHYNPKTGKFTRLIGNCNRVRIGDVTGTLNNQGYVQIMVNNMLHRAHRLAWLYMEGYWPEYQIDHKNGIRDDNRWKNLRHVTMTCNIQNQKTRDNNTSGFVGVCKSGNRWLSRISVYRKNIHLGYHSTPLEAALARFTFEMQCSQWTCNYRSELVKAIKNAWPEFKFGDHK